MRLDVRQMARRNDLRAGTWGSWHWHNSYTGEHTGTIGYAIREGELVLSYSINDEPKKQYVPILRTPCTYGGSRPWFGCPRCGRRVAVLYLRRGGFYCRTCAQVSYYSQSEDLCGRLWSKQHKAEAKLGANLRRPKGMHRTTRERLLSIIFACEEARDELLVADFAKLMLMRRLG